MKALRRIFKEYKVQILNVSIVLEKDQGQL